MNKDISKVSIIMATYNRAHFIVEALLSIQHQTYKHWECFIIDDGGTDNTIEVISHLLEHDSRFHYLKRPKSYKKGIPGCRNFGIDKSSGDYIIFFDDDDIVHPQNLELCLEAFEIHTYDFCVYEKSAFSETEGPINFEEETICIDQPISKNEISAIISNKIPMASCTVMWKKECFLNQKFNENLMYAEEWECYPRIISNNKHGTSLKNTLYFNRKHPVSNTGEYYTKSPIRVNSKKLAIKLLVDNLSNKNLFTPVTLKFLAGLSIYFRDMDLLNKILINSNSKLKNKLYLKLKFYMFPLWKIYKKTLKITAYYE